MSLDRPASRVYIIVEYTLSLEIESEFIHLSIFDPTPLLRESILVEYKTIPRKRHSNAILVKSNISREIEKTCFTCLFFDHTYLLSESILVDSK